MGACRDCRSDGRSFATASRDSSVDLGAGSQRRRYLARHAGCDVWRRIAPAPRARSRRVNRRPSRWPAALLPGATHRTRSGCANARKHVGRRIVAAEAGGGTGKKSTRAPPAAPQKEHTMTHSHRLDRNVIIQATPAIVFSFLTETPRWASWWGTGSEIDPRPGGRMKIRYPGGGEAPEIGRAHV